MRQPINPRQEPAEDMRIGQQSRTDAVRRTTGGKDVLRILIEGQQTLGSAAFQSGNQRCRAGLLVALAITSLDSCQAIAFNGTGRVRNRRGPAGANSKPDLVISFDE